MVRMDSRNTLIAATLAGLAVVSLLGPAATASAQATGNTPYVAVVAEEEVYLRSGNSDGHYPIGKVKRGELLRVVDEKYEWAQIQTVGPVFKRFHGLIKYPDRFANRLAVAPDGKSARTHARVDVIAPNPNVKPGESWKMIARLETDETVQILETGRTERGETLHKIVLPDSARVWIKKQYLRPATGEELSKWKLLLAGVDPDKAEADTRNQAAAKGGPKPVGAAGQQRPPAERVLARDSTPVKPPAEAVEAVTDEGEEPTAVTPNQPAEIVMQPGPDKTANPAARTPSPRPAPAKSAAEQRLEELEAMYARLQQEPIETAEIGPLRQLYLDLADEYVDHEIIQRYAGARAEQLDIWGELQQRRAEMKKIRARLQLTSEEAEAIRQAMNAGKDYIAVGRLSASVIYDGKSLPRLLRLQDPGTGRTVAYLEAEQEEINVGDMVGQLIGIVGSREYDGGLRLTLIRPTRVDLLTPTP